MIVKELRTEEDLSQEDVYNDTNIHIGRIETAKTNVTVSTLSALANIPRSRFDLLQGGRLINAVKYFRLNIISYNPNRLILLTIILQGNTEGPSSGAMF